MDRDLLQIRDLMILAQSDLAVAVSGMNGLIGRDYRDIQLVIARRGCNDAILKLNAALSIADEEITKTDDSHTNTVDNNGSYSYIDTSGGTAIQSGSTAIIAIK